MKTSIKKLPKSKLELKIEIPAEEFNQFFERAIFSLGKDLELPGFRKGKIPPKIIEKEIGKEKILKKAAEDAIRENYLKTIFENKIEVLGKPEIKILKLALANPFEFKVIVSIFPELKLPNYKKIASEQKKRKISISEKEIEETLSWIQRSRAKFTIKNGPAQKEDFIKVEYSSPQIENGKKIKDEFFLGKGGFIAGFEEKLEGIKNNEEREFSLKFPENHFQKNLAGKEIKFKVKAISVQKAEIPRLTDDLVKRLGKFENLSSLKKSIFEGIKIEKEKAESERIRKEILTKITDTTKFEIPQILIEEEKKRYLENLKKRVPTIFKMNFNDYLKEIKKTEKEIVESYHAVAEDKIKRALILRKIKEKEGIEAREEEIIKMANEILTNLPPEETKRIDPEGLKDYTKERIEEEKVLNFLENYTKNEYNSSCH
ncbi:hypothetical protein AMJ49_00075 [Parcubacteria bacterium DG_74_2]|nr:MAG: hypothetical protein AMJ49_00075 [Parcubacteria bacterium DG_74_2]